METTSYYGLRRWVVVSGKLSPHFEIPRTHAPSRFFLLIDALGSIVSTVNWSAGGASVQGNQLFGPYGNGRYYAGNLTTTKGFTGQYNDGLTGLDYFNARYYDPVAGVFLVPDSVQGNASGLNPYGYVAGNPETETDPSGRAYDWEQGGAGIGGEDDSFGNASTSAIESTGNGFEPAITVDWTTPTEQVWEENGQTYVTNFDANHNEISINPINAPDDLEAVDHGFVNSGETPQDRVEEPNGENPATSTHSNTNSPPRETPSSGETGHEPPGGNRPTISPDEPPDNKGNNPPDLYRMGNKSSPRVDNVRINRDVFPDESNIIYPGEGGISTFDQPFKPGNWWKLPGDTELPDGLQLRNDKPGHWLIEPARPMTVNVFKELLQSIDGWEPCF